MNVLELPEFARRYACVVDAYSESDLRTYIAPAEEVATRSFKSEKRRGEWVASRIAARHLAMERRYVAAPLDLRIASDLRPPRALAGGSELFVSFSHSHGAGAAALSDERIGVDLERVRAVDRRLQKFFLHGDEAEQAAKLHRDEALIHLWAAKEAAFKLIASLTLLKDVRLTDFFEDADGLDLGFAGATIRGSVRTARLSEDFVIAVALPRQTA